MITTALTTTTTAPTAAGFNYSTQTPAVARKLKGYAADLRKQSCTLVVTIIGVGNTLNAAKRDILHGLFEEWLNAEFDWSESTCRNYMRAAERFHDRTATVGHLKPTTVYALAARSTPATVRDDLVRRIESGEKLTDAEIMSELRSAKGSPAAPTTTAAKPAAAATSTPSSVTTDAEIATKALAEMMARHFGNELERARGLLRRVPGGGAIIAALDEIEPTPASEDAGAEDVAAALGEVKNSDDHKIIAGEFKVVAERTEEVEVEGEPEDSESDRRNEINDIPALKIEGRAATQDESAGTVGIAGVRLR